MFGTQRHGAFFLGGLVEDDSEQACSFVELNTPLMLLEVVHVICRTRHKSILMKTNVSDLKRAIFEEGPSFQIENLSVITPSRQSGIDSWGMGRLAEILQASDGVTKNLTSSSKPRAVRNTFLNKVSGQSR